MKKQVIGFTSVVGDLLHPGHLKMIEECKKQCDHLIVGFIVDPTDRSFKNEPVQSTFERYYSLRSNKHIDEIVPINDEEDLWLALSILNIDVRFVGNEYQKTEFTGKTLCELRGIKIIYNEVRLHGLSSSKLRERIFLAEEKNR